MQIKKIPRAMNLRRPESVMQVLMNHSIKVV